jgi:hypothetical protein
MILVAFFLLAFVAVLGVNLETSRRLRRVQR